MPGVHEDWKPTVRLTLSSLVQSPPADACGVGLDHDLPLADLLMHPDLPRCLQRGVLAMRDGMILGWLPPDRLAELLAEAYATAARERDEAYASRNELVANLGHELRTPINAIIGYAELIMASQGGRGSGPGPGYIDVIWEAAHHMLGTIDSILDLTRIEADAVELRESLIDVGGLMRSVGRMLSSSASVREIRILVTAPPDLPKLRGDARMLRQILINLVTNAIKYARGETDVSLSARIDRGKFMVIEVRDQGPGIPREALKLIMQPFQQLATHGFGAIGGTGLGLPLVKALVELHGGRFRLISAPGQGTRAVVVLPPSRIQEEPQPLARPLRGRAQPANIPAEGLR